MSEPDADRTAPIAHCDVCDADCAYDSLDDGPKPPAHCDADCCAPRFHYGPCDADAECDYDPSDDGPRDSMGMTAREHARLMRSEERAKVFTRWFAHQTLMREEKADCLPQGLVLS